MIVIAFAIYICNKNHSNKRYTIVLFWIWYHNTNIPIIQNLKTNHYSVCKLAMQMESPSGIKLFLKRLCKGDKAIKLQKVLEEKAVNGCLMLAYIRKLLGPPSTTDPTTISRPSHEIVFGRDEERRDIIRMLHEASSHSVIGIYGIAKSGTTTLAQYVCKYEEKQSYFSLVIWIDVSRCFDMDEIYRQMFEAASMGQQCPDLRNHETLRKMLDAKLRGKRFLMVLDGMQKAAEDKQRELLARLNTGTEGSKIIVTTWSKHVAMSLGARSPIKIRGLSEKDFLDLLMHYALGDGHRLDRRQRLEMLQEIGGDIAKQLGRSPWAARKVGEQIRRCSYLDVISPLIRELVACCKETIREELLRSFRHLDQPVRRCFAYCSLFPRMYRFKLHALIQLWMAQGFIETEYTATMCLNELVSWSLFVRSEGQPDDMWYTIPEIMHELLAEEAAGTDCLRLDAHGDEVEKVMMNTSHSRVRHLFVTSGNAMRFKSDIYKMKKVRTLIISGDGSGITVQVFERMLKELKKLRVLKVYLDAKKLKTPESVCALKHLRFLSILGSKLTEVKLPKNFGKLYNLQTIECPRSCHLDSLKVKKWSNLINLRYMERDDNKSPQESTHYKVH